MSHEQLISRNHHDLAEVIRVFHELNDAYKDQFVIYMDSRSWELFDTRICRTIIRHEFKHFNQFKSDMIKLKHDIIKCRCVSWSIGHNRKPKSTEVWSIKAILNIYGFEDKYFFDNQFLKDYIIHGIIKKKADLSDNH